MSNIVVISDSHNRLPYEDKFLKILDEADYIFHLGDGYQDIEFLRKSYPSKFTYVKGNCDFISGKDEAFVTVDKVKFMLTHGNMYGVKSGLLNLAYAAKESGVDCVLFGHTHLPVIEKDGSLNLINPGSLGYGRNYCYMSIHEGKFYAKLVQLV